MKKYSTTRTIQTDSAVLTTRRLYRELLAKQDTAKGEEKIDEDIIPFLNRLNRLRGVATVSSCSGHEIDGVYQDFYVSCIVSRQGLPYLLYFLDTLNQKLDLGKYRAQKECRYFIEVKDGCFTFRMNAGWQTFKKDFLFLLKS